MIVNDLKETKITYSLSLALEPLASAGFALWTMCTYARTTGPFPCFIVTNAGLAVLAAAAPGIIAVITLDAMEVAPAALAL